MALVVPTDLHWAGSRGVKQKSRSPAASRLWATARHSAAMCSGRLDGVPPPQGRTRASIMSWPWALNSPWRRLGAWASKLLVLRTVQCALGRSSDGTLGFGRQLDKKTMAVQWPVTRSTDPIDDSETISASLDASKGVNERERICLILQFHGQTRETKTYIQWHEFLWGDTERVIYRFPLEAAQTEEWLIGRDFRDDDGDIEHDITAVREPTLSVNKLLKSEQLVVRLPQKNEAPITAVFDLPSPPTEFNQLKVIAAG